MPKYLIDKEMILKQALKITDAQGIDKLTIKEISTELKVSSPAFYKHVDSLEDLKREVANRSLTMVKEEIVRSVTGKQGLDALKAMGVAFIHFAREHPGLYATIQWMNLTTDEVQGTLFYEVIQKVYDISKELGADELEASHIIRTVRSIAQGFADVDSHKGFAHESSVESSLEYAYETFFLGVQARMKNSNKEKN